MTLYIYLTYDWNIISKKIFGDDCEVLLNNLKKDLPMHKGANCDIWYDDRNTNEYGDPVGQVHIEIVVPNIEIIDRSTPQIQGGVNHLEVLFKTEEKHYGIVINTDQLHHWWMNFSKE